MSIYFKTISYRKYSLRKKQKVTQLIFSSRRLHDRVKSVGHGAIIRIRLFGAAVLFLKKIGFQPLDANL